MPLLVRSSSFDCCYPFHRQACANFPTSCAGQGFFAAVDRETLRFWRVTAADLAELAAGMTVSRPKWAPKARAADAEVKAEVQAHVATSDAPVVNTLWKVIVCLLDLNKFLIPYVVSKEVHLLSLPRETFILWQ